MGVRIDSFRSIQVLSRIKEAVHAKKRLVIVTPNSEFILRAQSDNEYRDLLNSADISVADGSGVQLAANILDHRDRGPALNWLIAIYECFVLLLKPSKANRHIPERIPGSQLMVDIASLAAKSGFRLYLLGGAEGVASAAAEYLTQRNPNLEIAGASGGDRTGAEKAQAAQIKASDAQIVLVAFGSPFQEQWIARTREDLPNLVFIGVGGSFDFLAKGRALNAGTAARFFPARQTPKAVSSLGLSWLWRLVTQPWRVGRIWRAVPYFLAQVVQYRHRHPDETIYLHTRKEN